jgi:hypothetical protein
VLKKLYILCIKRRFLISTELVGIICADKQSVHILRYGYPLCVPYIGYDINAFGPEFVDIFRLNRNIASTPRDAGFFTELV